MENTLTRKVLIAAILIFSKIGLYAQTQAPSNPNAAEDAKKAEWIKQHPQEYEQMSGQKQSDVPEFTNAEEKAKWLAEHPEFQAAPEVSTVKNAEPKEKAASAMPQITNLDGSTSSNTQVQSAMPEDPTFPVYADTGDPEKDQAEYEAKKKAWYEAKQAEAAKAEESRLIQEKMNRQPK